MPRSATAITLAVWKALFLREALARLARGRAAWLWLLLNPMFQIVFLMIVHSTIRPRVIPGVNFAVFLVIGILAFHMFRDPALRSMEAINANSALFAYRQVKPIDTVLVRLLLEGLLQVLVAVVLLTGSSFVGGLHTWPRDILGALAAYITMWFFAAGVGLILSVGTTLVQEIGHVATLAFLPLYLISGIIFPPFIFPAGVRYWLMFNPILHGIEWLRSVYIGPNYPLVPGVSLGYLAAWALVTICFGLILHVRFARRLIVE